jgi:hypothetical protein
MEDTTSRHGGLGSRTKSGRPLYLDKPFDAVQIGDQGEDRFGSFSTGTEPAVGPARSARPRKRTQHQRISVDLDGPLQVDGVHRTLRSSHPVKRASTDALLIATGAGGAGVRDLGASRGAVLLRSDIRGHGCRAAISIPRARPGIIDTARRFYQQ